MATFGEEMKMKETKFEEQLDPDRKITVRKTAKMDIDTDYTGEWAPNKRKRSDGGQVSEQKGFGYTGARFGSELGAIPKQYSKVNSPAPHQGLITPGSLANITDTSASRKPSIIPDKFDGQTPWLDYKVHFATCAAINGWTEAEKANFLAASLRGEAQEILGNLDSTFGFSIAKLSDLLDKRFGPEGQAEMFLAELRCIRRKKNESLQALGQRIRRWAKLSYPGMQHDALERLARWHFEDAIPEAEIRAGIFRAKAKTLEEAVRAGLEAEAYLAGEKQRMLGKYANVKSSDIKFTRPLHGEKFERSQENLSEKLDKLTAMFEAFISSRESDKNNGNPERSHKINCYRCKKPGHYARDCPE